MLLVYILPLLCAHFIRALEIECDPQKPYIVHLSTYPTGNVYSPGFLKGADYPIEIQCQITLESSINTHIRLKFSTIDIEVSDLCKTDFLALVEFSKLGNQVARGKFCGNETINDIMSDTNRIVLVFKSDYIRTAKGFNVSYELSQTRSLCQRGELQCKNRKCLKSASTLLCNGKDDCGDGTDEEDCGLPVAPVTKCGKPDVAPILQAGLLDRIVGGMEARPGSWPWQVDMQVAYLEPNGHFCGGTLLNAQWFVTAAHCFGNTRIPHQIRIHLGNHHKFKKDPYEEVRFVKDYFIYGVNRTDFIKDGLFHMDHDLALAKLNAPIQFNSHIQPACLPSQNEELHYLTPCVATGWGETRGSNGSGVLKQANHPVQKENACFQPYQKFNNKTMICAGKMDPLNGLCHGDSGGPLVCKKNGLWHVYGAASFVTETNLLTGICGLPKKPTVFNKISQKIDYITSTMYKN